MRAVVFFVVLLAGGCAGLISVPPRPVPPSNFCYVDGFDVVVVPGLEATVLRAPQPTAQQIACMRDLYGLTDVFKLNPWWEAREPVVPGVMTHYHPLDVEGVTRAQVDDVVTDMLRTCEARGKTCLIHCTHGQDRTGLISAIWRLVHGEDVDAVYADMMRHGFHPFRGLWRIWTSRAGW